ncbi:MAG: DUF2490 domain-containing protein [Proteobacteria bacterium]|nr:DUF2490 domain-containing protein [Pseudomonadota bacterium]
MISRRLLVHLALLVGFLIAPAAEAGNQIWTATFLQARTQADSGVTGWLDLHGRRREDGFVGIVRPGLGYAFSPALSVFAGYAYIPTLTDEGGNKREQRIWQQVIVTQPLGADVKVSGRLRLEQRFGSGDELGHRMRAQLRGQWTASPGLHLVAWDEAFFGLNDTDWAAKQGYDQNRLFVGLGVDTKVKGVRVEAGYLNLILTKDAKVDHAISVNVFMNLWP